MSSPIRTIQKRMFERQGKRPYDHTEGPFVTVTFPNPIGGAGIEVERPAKRWPQHPRNFNPVEK